MIPLGQTDDSHMGGKCRMKSCTVTTMNRWRFQYDNLTRTVLGCTEEHAVKAVEEIRENEKRIEKIARTKI